MNDAINAKLTYVLNKTTCHLVMPDPGDVIMASIETKELCDKHWCIQSWYNHAEKYQRQGYGKLCLRILVEDMIADKGEPESITYIWNGANDYVGNLVTEKWGGVCKTPLAVLKHDSADSWDNHEYVLDVNRFLEWIRLYLPTEPRNDYNPDELVGPLTRLLDENCDLTKESEKFRHYILADKISVTTYAMSAGGDTCRCLPIRRPGGTVGGVWVDEKNRILKVQLGSYKTYSANIKTKLRQMTYAHLMLPEA